MRCSLARASIQRSARPPSQMADPIRNRVQHAVDDDRAAALAVAAVAELHERAGAALVVAGGDVVEH